MSDRRNTEWWEPLCSHHGITGATPSTVEAFVYSCRQGPKALEHRDNIRRLGLLSEQQLREICSRVQRFRHDLQYGGTSAVRWSMEEARDLISKWTEIHG